jgi:sugar phosphate isomerase/epimerase
MTQQKNIFVSTTFAEDNSKVSEILKLCKKARILNVELGSNHAYEKNFDHIIKKYNFRFLVHNYFPIPKRNFVVNIASLNNKIRNLSLQHAKRAISFCKKINSKLYTIHPGFLLDPIKANSSTKNYDFLKKITNFAKNRGVKVAIETEGSFNKSGFLLMQRPKEYKRLFKYFKPKELGINLNIGHLNLASNAFNFSKTKFVNNLKPYILAFELSHNNGIEDQHLPLKKKAWYWKIIKDPNFSKVYKILEFRNTNIKKIKETIKLFEI